MKKKSVQTYLGMGNSLLKAARLAASAAWLLLFLNESNLLARENIMLS